MKTLMNHTLFIGCLASSAFALNQRDANPIDELPSWGAYIRHARNIEFNNVEMQTRAPDKRKKIVLDDVEGFVER